MITNYKKWFFDQYKYLIGQRDNKESYNDTKWIDILNRYKQLNELHSELPQQQPFGVMGNSYAFDQFIQLLSRSNYTFEDLNESLINTYKYSLRNCMGINNVNTHVVIFKTKNTNKKYVVSDGSYYIVDVPFDQMSFGGRDEFIRQKLHDIHTTENNKYIPFNEFISNDLDDILGFSFLCSVNGYICNDCQVAIDDKGFKFKIKWLYSSDVTFIIYKVDTCFVHDVIIDTHQLSTSFIDINDLKTLVDKHGRGPYQCILNIYDDNYKSSQPTPINFGLLTNKGLSILNIQDKTLDIIDRNKSKNVHVVIYVLKYFYEVPNLYPAINYYELIETGKVYTDKHDKVVDVNHDEIIMSETNYRNNLEVCTPPISLDHSSSISFKTIQNCLRLDVDMMTLNKKIQNIGITLSNPMTGSIVMSNIIQPLTDIIPKLKSYYITYNEGCILTSLIPSKYVNEFATFVTGLQSLLDTANEVVQQQEPNYLEISKHDVPQIYGNNYSIFVDHICEPFKDKKLETISRMKSLSPNYFVDDNTNQFNRPISQYCFMVLKYDNDEGCWLLDNPTIKHFHGISNTFYIDSDLNGAEIFKFFVFYSDTQNPSEKTIPPLTQETILDYDKFVNEVDKHMGYVKYWNVENKLLKYCNILYNKYDQDTCIQVLSKILKQKLIDNDLLFNYPSIIEYSLSGINQLNYKDYTDDTEHAPFALNYLFYTLNMMNYGVDKLQSYFVHRLTDRRFNNRFIDLPITQLINTNDSLLVNYSHFSQYPTSINIDACELPNNSYNAFYGYGNIVSDNGYTVETNPYPYVYNIYTTDISYPLITENGDIDNTYFIKYNTLPEYGHIDYAYNIDITCVKYITEYIGNVYSYISQFQTDYTTIFNKTWLCNISIETIQTLIDDLNKYTLDNQPTLSSTINAIDSIVNDNEFISIMNQLKSLYSQCIYIQYQGNTISIFSIINDLLRDLRYTYHMFGFDNYAMRSIRALYIHLKKINTTMNIYEFKHWLSGINYPLLVNMKYMFAKNKYSDISQNTFNRYAQMISIYIQQCYLLFDQITELIESLSTSFHSTYIEPLITYCLNTINSYTFDMYCISNINVTSDTIYPTRPYVVTTTINTSDTHFKIPNTSSQDVDNTLILIPICETINDSYKIKSMVGICRYCVFDDTKITNQTGVVKSIEGTQIGSVSFDIEFTSTANSSTITNDIYLLNDLLNMPVDIRNPHEIFNINEDDKIVNLPRTPYNYELYAGNHFKPLQSTHELINGDLSPLDRIYISNTEINNLVSESLSTTGSYGVYFKPVQVLHPPKDVDNIMTSIGGKYKPGQKIYLYTKDLGFVFPATITTIDSNESHGFVECVIDSYNSKWFNVEQYSDIVKYFTTNIECGVVDDNISNFMDEFNNTSNVEYNIVPFNIDISDVDKFTLPGDPIYVVNNAPYVYTRLNYMFNETIPDRFYNDEIKLYSLTFLGSNNLYGDNDTISINMITHNYQPFTENELYTELRGEPNDHDVYNEEKTVFTNYLNTQNNNISLYKNDAEMYLEMMRNAETEYQREMCLLQYENALYNLSYAEDFATRLTYMIEQPEQQTRWYNVYSYESAYVYMNNGRGKLNTSYIPNISYIQSLEDINIFIYDWDNKYWIPPEFYTIEIENIDNVNFGNKSNYITSNVVYKMNITFDSTLPRSKSILFYMGYNKSDLFDDIDLHNKTCYVKFKPLITTINSNHNPYNDIKIRKHFDGFEQYTFDEPNTPDDFANGECYKITRYDRNGNYQYSPSIRMCDLTVTSNNVEYDYTYFDLYVPNPFNDTTTNQTFKQIQYNVTIIQPIDNFNENQIVKLICISNNELSKYNGLLSSVLFEGKTTNDSITINESSLGYVSPGHYICTIIPSSDSSCVGGLIDVEVTYTQTDIVDDSGAWICIPNELSTYREIPHEFIIKPKSNEFDYTSKTTFTFNTKYINNITDVINENNNQSINNPYEYYNDTKNNIRLPISDVRHNQSSKRFVVNTTSNPDIEIIKTPYISICRYSLNNIPEDGIIDVTGFIPTPLSRKRYEFYVNGRIINGLDIIILSPTSFQLINLVSLKNFELIELVDDAYDSSTFIRDNVYISNTGKMYGSYEQMILSNEEVVDQSIRFIFNTDQQLELYKHNTNITPNNRNVEPDILDNISYNTPSTIPYYELYNLPSINGVQLNNLTTKDFGLSEIPETQIIDMLNKTWKREILTNPDFPSNHYLDKHRTILQLHTSNVEDIFPDIDNPDDWVCVYVTGNMNKYFTLYISNSENGNIDDVNNTLKIIPFVKTGMYVMISSSYKSKWLHMTTTVKNVAPSKPILIK